MYYKEDRTMFHGFLLPRGPRSTDEARAGHVAQPVPRVEAPPARLTVRLAEPVDEDVLRRIAALDSSRFPRGLLLVGEIGGSIQAAVPVSGGRAIANPFVRTAELVTLLEMRAEQLREQGVGQAELARVIPLPRQRQALAGRIA
jgi:hypothetical protein